MAILTQRQLSDMADVAKKMVETYALRTALVLTPEEFVTCFIAPEHRAALEEVEKIVGSVDATVQYPFSHHLVDDLLDIDGTCVPITMSLALNFSNGKPLPIPKYIGGGLQKSAPEDVVTRIRAWAMDRRRIGMAAGVSVAALHWLNQTCGNVKAASIMFPALTTLIARLDDNDKRGNSTGASVAKAQKVASSKNIGALPAATPKLRKMIYEASQVINSLVLVQDAPEVQVPRNSAFLWMHSSSFHPDTAREFANVGVGGLQFI